MRATTRISEITLLFFTRFCFVHYMSLIMCACLVRVCCIDTITAMAVRRRRQQNRRQSYCCTNLYTFQRSKLFRRSVRISRDFIFVSWKLHWVLLEHWRQSSFNVNIFSRRNVVYVSTYKWRDDMFWIHDKRGRKPTVNTVKLCEINAVV